MASGDASAMPMIDAHQHFWDIDKNYYPWLCDPAPIPFRYGDYSALRRNYLPPDYARDSAGFNIVKTVHMEAEWDRANPVAETRWLEAINRDFGLPSACIGHAELDRPDIEEVLAGHAESPLMRGIRHKPKAASGPREAKRGAAGSMDDSVWRKGYALLERFGLSYDLQTPWWHLDAAADLAADFPRIQSSSITRGCRRIAAAKGSRLGGARLPPLPRSQTSPSRFPASAAPGCLGR